MRNAFWLVIVLVVLGSCKNTQHQSSEHGHSHDVEQNHKHDNGKEFTTKTGKIIVVKESHAESESLVSVEISAAGFENGNHFILKDIDPVVYIELIDLDENGFEELYIITQSAGSGSYLNVHAYASNKDLSLSPIYFPELNNTDFEEGALFEGYMGHDTFYFQDGTFVRQFPIYKKGDSNSNPTGGTKEISYLLVKGEASWQLKPQQIVVAEVVIVRNCTGTYIRFNEQDYKVCNQELLSKLKNDDKVNVTFEDSNRCKLPKDMAICAMYHPFKSSVNIVSIND